MNKKTLGAALVLAAALAIIVGRQASSRASPSPDLATVTSDTPGAASPRVVLIADLGEAQDKCTCGDLIRAVRAAAQKGLATKEIDTRTGTDAAKPYTVRVVPTVIFFDGAGKEQHRYEGESSDVLKFVRRELDALSARK